MKNQLLSKQLKEYIYIDKDIEWTDSITNNVMYVDTVLNGQVKMILENLKSRKKKFIIRSDGKPSSFMLNI
jgi:DnaJ-class molecular chaperone